MSSVQSKHSIESHDLPKRLQTQFAALKARLWRVELILCLTWCIFAFLISFLSVFFLDRWYDTPGMLRATLLMVALATLCLVSGWWTWRWILSKRNLRDYSKLVQRRYRILGDRLLGIVELTEDAHGETSYSDELYHAAIRQVDGDARNCDFEGAVSTKTLRRLASISSMLVGLTFILLLLLPGAFTNALSRWLLPNAQTARYTLVTIQPDTADHLAIRGEPFWMEASVDYLSFWKPSQITVQLDSGYQLTGEVKENRIRMEIPGQFKETAMHLSVGDGSAKTTVKPLQRPTLLALTASIRMPDYLQRPDETFDIQSGNMDILQGSGIQLNGTINRDLQAVDLQWGSNHRIPVDLDGSTFSTDWLSSSNVFDATLKWTDGYGFTNAIPWNLGIEHREDQPPSFLFPELYREMAILETEVLEMKTEVRDDYGVREFGIQWETMNGIQPSKETLDVDFRDASLHRAQDELNVSFYFSPTLYNVTPGDVVELLGYVTDFFPGRSPSQTAVYRIHVVSSVEHAERIRQRLESLLTQLEDVSRLEQSIASATAESLEQMEALAPEDLAARLEDQANDQKLNANHLAGLAREGMETLREAMRNPAFTDEVMSDWTETLSEMQQLAEDKMQEAASSLAEASSSQSGTESKPGSQPKPGAGSATSQKQAMQAAQATEQEILERLEDLQSMVNEDLDQLQALTLAQRLRKLGVTETELEATLMEGAEDTIGLFPEELAPRWRALHAKLGETQGDTATQSQELQEEIGRFFERTQKEPYGDVSADMRTKETFDGINTTRELIQKNITMDAADQVAVWAKQFETWASQLEPQEESEGGGGGEGGGESEEQDLTQQLMALLRMREGELNLRMQTRLLGRQQGDTNLQMERARELATEQEGLQENLMEVRTKIPIPFLDPIFEEIHSHMGNAADALLRGQTDERAVKPETLSIQTLTDAINILNEQAQKNSSSSSSASQAMSFMMQMMMASQGMGQEANSQAGGGSMSGGDTDQAATDAEGKDDGDVGESRGITRGSGQSANLPTEFRQSFEAYYMQLEQLDASPNRTGETP
jgi:hypothetical protein